MYTQILCNFCFTAYSTPIYDYAFESIESLHMLTGKCFRFQVLMLRLYIAEGSLSLKYIKKSYLGKKNILNFQKDLFINTHVPFPPLKFEIMEKNV